MALYSLFKLTVLCALFQAAAAIECSGTRTPENSPFGVYSNVKPVPVGKMGMEVTTVDLHFDTKTTAANFNSDVTYKQHLIGCLFEQAGDTYECKTGKFPLGPDMTFTNGHFYDTSGTGSKFIPVDKRNLNPFEKFIDDNLKIQWLELVHSLLYLSHRSLFSPCLVCASTFSPYRMGYFPMLCPPLCSPFVICGM